jgi:hypothetical protein
MNDAEFQRRLAVSLIKLMMKCLKLQISLDSFNTVLLKLLLIIILGILRAAKDLPEPGSRSHRGIVAEP